MNISSINLTDSVVAVSAVCQWTLQWRIYCRFWKSRSCPLCWRDTICLLSLSHMSPNKRSHHYCCCSVRGAWPHCLSPILLLISAHIFFSALLNHCPTSGNTFEMSTNGTSLVLCCFWKDSQCLSSSLAPMSVLWFTSLCNYVIDTLSVCARDWNPQDFFL